MVNSMFFRVVRNNKNDVGFPHRDSSFWKLGKLYARKAPFNYIKKDGNFGYRYLVLIKKIV